MYRIFKVPQIGFIGAGVLSEALTKGWVSAGTVQIHEVWASAPTERDIYKATQLGVQTTTCNLELVNNNKLVVLVAKPQVLPMILKEIAPAITPDHLLLSFAAGLNIQAMQQLLPPGTRLARLMTNTPVQFRQGVSSFSLGPNCTPDDRNTISKLLEAIGYCTEVKEELVDTVTGFAGGGPAYIYCVIEAIADGAVLGGINRQEAMQMAARTVIGAATMIQETKKHPGQLKDEVCSAGGSTINGVKVLEQGGMRGTMIEAVRASAERSKELGKLLKESMNLEKLD